MRLAARILAILAVLPPISAPGSTSAAEIPAACPDYDALPADALVAAPIDYNTQGPGHDDLHDVQGFTDADEVIYSRHLERQIEAYDGDDTIFIYDAHGTSFVYGGRGADTLVLCSMQAYDLYFTLGATAAPDEDPDIVVIEAAAFLSGTPGFARSIIIDGFIVGIDTLVLRVPESMGVAIDSEPAFNQSIITVGDTRLFISHPLDGMGAPSPFLQADSDRLIVETVDIDRERPPVPAEPRPIPAACLDVREPPEGAVLYPPIEGASVNLLDDPNRLTTGDDLVISRELRADAVLDARGGDDTIFLYEPHGNAMPLGGPGRDVMVICTMTDYSLTIFPSVGTVDDEPDTIVIETPVFTGVTPGLQRHIEIFSFFVGIDTLVLRVPSTSDVSVGAGQFGDQTEIVVDETLISVMHPPRDLAGTPGPVLSLGHPGLVIERVDPPANEVATLRDGPRPPPTACPDFATLPPDALIVPTSYVGTEFGDLDGSHFDDHGHGDGHHETDGDLSALDNAQSLEDLTAAMAEMAEHHGDDGGHGHGVDDTDPFYFGAGDDVIHSHGLETYITLSAGDGNDTIFIYEPRNEAYFVGGRGDDIIVLCSMSEFSTAIFPSRELDDDADTVVIEPSVFEQVPPGFVRSVRVMDFHHGFDQLVLRTPSHLSVDVTPNPNFPETEIRVGDTLITVNPPETSRAQDLVLSADSDAFVIEPVAREIRADVARPLAPPAAPAECPLLDDPPVGAQFTPTSEDGLPADALMGSDHFVFSDGDDLIIAERVSFMLDAGDGDDLIFVYDPIDALIIDGGPGRDVIVLCTMTGYQVGLSGYLDADADMIVIEESVFEDVAPGFRREIDVSGFVVDLDQLVVRVPADMSVSVEPRLARAVSEINVGDTRITVRHPFVPEGDASLLTPASDSLRIEADGQPLSGPGQQRQPSVEASVPSPAVPISDRGQIAELQDHLNALGFDAGPADGLFGRRTIGAITAFQASLDLPETGTPDRALLDRLRRARETLR